jgi:hypothetical protein
MRESTDAAHSNFNRGDEHWLMAEAKLRNPRIELLGLVYAWPSWVNPNGRSPYGSNLTEQNAADYMAAWVSGLKTSHNLTIEQVEPPRLRGLQQLWLKTDDQVIHCSPTADSTSVLAGAFSRSHTTVTLAAGQTCVSEPLVVTGVQNLTLLLEDGAEIQAKRGSQLFGTLLSLESTSGVIIQGGAPSNRISSSGSTLPADPYAPSATELARPTLKMWRQDYSNQTLYNHSEHRHALSLHRCSQVTLRNLRFTGSGGDGIYVSGVVGGVFDSLTVDTNFRQGMSIIEAQGLIVVDSVFASTRGTAPMAGIDFVSGMQFSPHTQRAC